MEIPNHHLADELWEAGAHDQIASTLHSGEAVAAVVCRKRQLMEAGRDDKFYTYYFRAAEKALSRGTDADSSSQSSDAEGDLM